MSRQLYAPVLYVAAILFAIGALVFKGGWLWVGAIVAAGFGTYLWMRRRAFGSFDGDGTVITPAPGTPKPITPAPGTPKPITPAPGTPKPITPAPGTPKPITPAPGTPKPITPAPGTPKPITPVPRVPGPPGLGDGPGPGPF